MAQRYGGKYSPQGAGPVEAGPASVPAATTAGNKAWALFLPPLLFALQGFRSDPRGLFFGLSACGLLLLAAWLTREGLRAEAAFQARRLARRPAVPRKMLGAAITGLGLAVGGLMAGPGLAYPLLFGLAGAALHLGAFGLDPLRDKGMTGVDLFQTDRVARAVDEAERYLAGMNDAILRAGDRGLETRVARFADTARTLFRTIEGDPGDLTAARKYLSVYLMGARDATAKFADHFAQTRDAKARADYEGLLTDLETNFAQRTRALLSDSHTDLDVEIQVLRERLQLDR